MTGDLRPNKVKNTFLVLLPGHFLPSDNTQTDRQTDTHRHREMYHDGERETHARSDLINDV